MEDFWTRWQRDQQGPTQAWGDLLTRAAPPQTTNWGQVPHAQETLTGNFGGPQQGGWGDYQPNTQPIDYMPASAPQSRDRFLQEWAYGGDQLGNGQYANGAWQHGAPIAAGTDLGTLGIATRTGYRLPVGYDSRQDTFRGELNGRVHETSWSRAIRRAQDMVTNGQAGWDEAIKQSIASVEQEARAQGKTTGFGAAGGGSTQQGGGDKSITVRDNGQQGGTGVVSPLNNQAQPGMASGAPMTAPGQQMGVPQTGGGGLYNQYVGQDKAARMAALLDRLGLGDLAAQYSGAGQVISNVATRMFDPWLTTQGMDPNGAPMMDNVTGLMDQFVNRMKGPGFYQGVANDARAGLANFTGGKNPMLDPRAMPVNELQQLLEGFNSMIYGDLSGSNPWIQQAFGRRANDALGQYKRAELAGMQGGGGYLNYYDFLQGDPRFQFMVGR